MIPKKVEMNLTIGNLHPSWAFQETHFSWFFKTWDQEAAYNTNITSAWQLVSSIYNQSGSRCIRKKAIKHSMIDQTKPCVTVSIQTTKNYFWLIWGYPPFWETSMSMVNICKYMEVTGHIEPQKLKGWKPTKLSLGLL